jgi:hypothetical protein
MAITRLGPNQSVNLASNVTGTLPTANGGTGATSFTKGKVLQVVTAVDSTNRSTTSTSFVTASNTLSVDITPSATSSKILIQVSCMIYINTGYGNLTIYRDSTNLATAAASNSLIGTDGDGAYYATSGLHFLDSPSSTSQLTYQVYFKTNGNSVQLSNGTALGNITAYEIEG